MPERLGPIAWTRVKEKRFVLPERPRRPNPFNQYRLS